MNDPIAQQVFALYAHAPKRDRLHVKGRWKSCPVAAVDGAVPRAGRVLEVGCGHGLVSSYLALSSSEREVLGCDIDTRKIAVASHASSHVRPPARVEFRESDGASLPPGPWDAIVIVDVLYLLDRDAERALVARCADALVPGGVLVLKETDVKPRYKHLIARAQEVVATKIVRITEGSTISFTPVAELVALLESCGLRVTTTAVDKGYLHPHALIVGHKPGGRA